MTDVPRHRGRRLRIGRIGYRSHITKGNVMPEAVIVATARSPIGRANKGSLVDASAPTTCRPRSSRR